MGKVLKGVTGIYRVIGIEGLGIKHCTHLKEL